MDYTFNKRFLLTLEKFYLSIVLSVKYNYGITVNVSSSFVPNAPSSNFLNGTPGYIPYAAINNSLYSRYFKIILIILLCFIIRKKI